MATVIKVEPLKSSLKSIAALSGPAMETLCRQWAFRYRTFIQARFALYSRGGGDWPALKRSTLLARARRTVKRAVVHINVRETADERRKRIGRARRQYAKVKAKIDAGQANAAILRDTGVLFAALNPHFLDAPGSVFERIHLGVRVGFGGPATHDSGGPTIGQIAAWHDAGAGHNPRRQIIVEPDAATIAGMARDADAAVAKALRDARN